MLSLGFHGLFPARLGTDGMSEAKPGPLHVGSFWQMQNDAKATCWAAGIVIKYDPLGL